jgi:exosome complex RNA-binding protein Rrp42 (RNase PH superfamily)
MKYVKTLGAITAALTICLGVTATFVIFDLCHLECDGNFFDAPGKFLLLRATGTFVVTHRKAPL